MNNEQLIKNLIKQGESGQLEFKEIVRKEDIAKTLCAFLNADGGTVLIGVNDNGKIIGVDQADKSVAELKQYLFQSIIPEAPVTISKETIGPKEILLIKVWNGSKPPYIFNGEIFFRRGSKTVKATPADISKLITERQKTELHWERQAALGVDLDDLDELEIRKTIQDLAKYGRGKQFSEKEVEDFLTYYSLYRDGHFTNAAVILFAKEPSKFLPQSRIRLTVFNDSKTSDSYSYDKVFEGNLFRNIDEIIQFFEVNIATQSKFSEKKWLREDLSYPKLALREGLMNALIHRDFSNVSGTVHIAFYPTHLEITNSGKLYGGYSTDDLAKSHLSVPRNPDIAHICFLRQMIEKIGRGTVLMIEDCESKGFERPKWNTSANSTTVVFNGVTVTVKHDAVSDTVNDAVNDAVKKGKIDAVSDAVSDALIDTVNTITKLSDGASINDIMDATRKSNATVKRYLQVLREAKLIEFKGAAKTGRYYLTKEATKKIQKKK
ncbi:MAG: RNA-binding domain-containing protein [Flavobacteriales bacterium]